MCIDTNPNEWECYQITFSRYYGPPHPVSFPLTPWNTSISMCHGVWIRYFQNDLPCALLNWSEWWNLQQLWWKTVGWKEISELAPTKRGNLGWFEVTICGIMKIMFATSSLFTKQRLSTLPQAYTMRWQLCNKVQLVYPANAKRQSGTQYLTNVTAVWRSVKASGYRSYAYFNCLPKLNRQRADGKR